MLISTSKTVALCSFSNLINAADRALMPLAVLQMSSEFKWDMYSQGWLLSAFPIGYFSSQIIGASFAKRFGGKNVLTFAVLIWSLLTFFTPLFAYSYRILMVSRILLGIAEGVGLPAVVQIFSTCVLMDERSRAFGYLVAFGSFGQTAAAIICPHLTWRWMFLLFGSIGFFWVSIWIFSFREIKIITEDDDFIIIPPKLTNRTKWFDYFKSSQLWSIYLAHFSMSWTSNIITTWIPFYLSRYLGVSATALSFTAVPYIINSFSGILAGHLADSLIMGNWTVLSVRRLMTTIGLVGPGIGLIIFMGIDNLVLAFCVISMCMALLACNSCGHLANHLDVAPNLSAITFGISNTIATIPGMLIGPLTAELVVKSGGRWLPVFLIAALVNFVGAIIYYSHSGASQII
ncbi:unnamed protein product [Brachionus calyciflorus]|uniref:Major facilitator superfamily (MFS) profile domain-containing protein n=1 Tax=Brachionus calyciflorus TaxID=104777 RepID=A0A813QL59_9BILA|nr:unnamed protein product [Brachionus calyciflorus]